jgi:hypothetical protein
MANRTERRAENQYRFNDANDRLREIVHDQVSPGRTIPFLCECADDTCLARVDLKQEEYESLHEGADVFVIVPGHPRVNGEIVLQRQAGFEQVQKPGNE